MSDEHPRRERESKEEVAEVPKDPRLLDAEVELAKARISKERAATYQSLAMAVLTGLSAVAVGMTLFQGRKQHQPLNGTLVKPQ